MLGWRLLTVTGSSNLPLMKFPDHLMVSIRWEPSVTFSSTVSVGSVPMSDSWIRTVIELEDVEILRIEGRPGRTVCAHLFCLCNNNNVIIILLYTSVVDEYKNCYCNMQLTQY